MAGIECSITIKSVQVMGEEQDSTTEVYSGLYMDRLNKRYLSYKRVSEDGETASLINFDENSMCLTQQGAIRTKMEFKLGERTYNEYGTPAGKLVLCIRTDEYSMVQQDDYIEIKLLYSILTGEEEAVKTDMKILVKF